jgi:hypothetical protein
MSRSSAMLIRLRLAEYDKNRTVAVTSLLFILGLGRGLT